MLNYNNLFIFIKDYNSVICLLQNIFQITQVNKRKKERKKERKKN